MKQTLKSQTRNRELVAKADLLRLFIECFRACTRGLQANTKASPMVCVPLCSVNRDHRAAHSDNRKATTSNNLTEVANCRLHWVSGRITSRSNCEQCFATAGTYRDLILISHPQLCRCCIAPSGNV